MKTAIVLCAVVMGLGMAEDFEYNTGGSMGTMPTAGGSNTGWGEWFITTVENDTGYDLALTQFGFPCCGDATDTLGWIVWTDVGGMVAPSGGPSSCDYNGAFVPADPDSTFPPDTYTYVDVSAENIVIPDGNFFCFGYDVTKIGGHIDYNGVETWAWYENAWDPDQGWGRTAVMEIYANYASALEGRTWGDIKSSF